MERRKRSRSVKKKIAAAAYFCGIVTAMAAVGAIQLLHCMVSTGKAIQSALPTGDILPQHSAAITPLPSIYPAASGYLVIVNFDNPTGDERPEGLVCVTSVFGDEVVLQNENSSENSEADRAASEMFKAASAQGMSKYKITSAYRSTAYQQTLWEERLKTEPNYGSDPYNNPVKVMPGGMSEHATGLAMDILSVAHDRADDAYGETQEGRWLAQNAHKYGFILRYPKDKEHITGVIYEPWHFRYVGKKAAGEIYKQGICLEEYLGKV
ncbi:MAG: M15 family metallopeptidase [Clostridia bacterium]|nr:M15 family metallopeptidase [Clostridia bacterium]